MAASAPASSRPAVPNPVPFVLLACLVLAVVLVLLRLRARRVEENPPTRWQYTPLRYSLSDNAGGELAAGVQEASAMQRTITVNLGERSYDVRIAPGELDRLGAVAAGLPAARSAVVIADATVAELYGAKAVRALQAAGLMAAIIDFPAGEEHKTLATFGHVVDELLAVSPPIDRDTPVVALGGGVTGDLAGFVAATALRGLRYVQCPTTLLADVDSSVGGKTAVDHPAGKNLIGAFHQPVAVLIDVSALKTLDERQIRTGLAECVKHGMIRDATLLDFIDANAAGLLAADESLMTELVARNVAIKAAVVSADERESGERSHLNFGHTVGHAIETHLGLGTVTHGEAVSLGMVAECHLAVARGLAKPEVLQRLEGLLKKLGLPTRRTGLEAAALWAIMQHDKKARSGKVRMVLPTDLGRVSIFDDIADSELTAALAEMAG
jgi:3-dehydroquinate synthase